jgi:hypothetical protein
VALGQNGNLRVAVSTEPPLLPGRLHLKPPSLFL